MTRNKSLYAYDHQMMLYYYNNSVTVSIFFNTNIYFTIRSLQIFIIENLLRLRWYYWIIKIKLLKFKIQIVF